MVRKQIGQWLCCLFLSCLLVVLSSTFIHGEQIQNRQSSIRLAATTSSVEPELTLKTGDESGEVLKLQQQLRALGFYLGPTTGYYGETTTKAVRAFQQQQQLTQTGTVDTKTFEALSNAFDAKKRVLKLGDKGSGVAQLQKKLGVSTTGEYDLATEEAVKRFQRDKGLAVDGVVDLSFLAALGLPAYLGPGGSGSTFEEQPEITEKDFNLNVADVMKLGEGYWVELKLTGAALAKSEKIKSMHDASSDKTVKINKIRAELIDSPPKAFTINLHTEKDQPIFNKEAARWRWQVTPSNAPSHRLSVIVSYLYKDPEGKENPVTLDFSLLPHDIKVEMNFEQTVDFYVQKIDWAKTTLGAISGFILWLVETIFSPIRKISSFLQSRKSKSTSLSPPNQDEPPSSKL